MSAFYTTMSMDIPSVDKMEGEIFIYTLDYFFFYFGSVYLYPFMCNVLIEFTGQSVDSGCHLTLCFGSIPVRATCGKEEKKKGKKEKKNEQKQD